MPASKKPDSNEQHKRFVDAARELGCDETEETFDRVLGKIAKAPPPKSVQKRKRKRKRKPEKRRP